MVDAGYSRVNSVFLRVHVCFKRNVEAKYEMNGICVLLNNRVEAEMCKGVFLGIPLPEDDSPWSMGREWK